MDYQDGKAIEEIISRYDIPRLDMDKAFGLNFLQPFDVYHSLSNFSGDSIINLITDVKRRNPTGIFSSQKIKLRDELLPYPNIELIFELIPGIWDSSPLVIIITLKAWLKNKPLNQVMYDLIKSEKQFRSKFNNNWILIPPNLRMGVKLHKEIASLLLLNAEQEDSTKTNEVDRQKVARKMLEFSKIDNVDSYRTVDINKETINSPKQTPQRKPEVDLISF